MMSRLIAVCVAILWGAIAFAQQGYLVQPGDTLRIEVLEDPSLDRDALVLPDGRISFPLIGSYSTRGKSTETIQRELAAGLAPNFASTPSVFVTVSSIGPVAPSGLTTANAIDVYIMGEVISPGLIAVEKGTTLLQVLAQSGGFTRFAATKRIQLRRVDSGTGQLVAYNFNYRAVEDGARISGRTVLADGDVIVVPQRRLFE